MYKKIKLLSTLAVMSLGALLFVSCDKPNNENSNNKSDSQIINNTNEATSFTVVGVETLKTSYSIDDIFDLSGLSINLYDSNNVLIKNISIYDDDVEINGTDTSEVGEKTLEIKYKDLESFTYNYSVVEDVVTLYLNNGTFNEQNIIDVKASNGQYYIGDITPECNDASYIFAGWFLDEDLTERVEYVTNGYIEASNNTKLYAGYDVNYSNLFDYEINYVNKSVKINSISSDYSIFFGMEELYIPETIELYPVVEIGEKMFFIYDDLFGEETNVGEYFFDLKTIRFAPNSHVKTIGEKAFYGLYVENVYLSEGLINIGKSAFETCTRISEIQIPSTVQRIEENAFTACYGMTSIQFEKYGELTYIGKGAFENASALSKIDLPEGLEQISSYAFSGCTGLRIISIPSSVTFIGVQAFKNTSVLDNIDVDENNLYYCSIAGNLFSKDMKKMYRYSLGKKETSYVVPSTVISIEESCFNIDNCYPRLTEIILPNGLKEIYDDAFAGNTAKIDIPASVEKITSKAFYHYKTDKISLSPNNPYFSVDSNGILYNFDYTQLICVPKNTNITNFHLDNRVQVINSYAFIGADSIRMISIDEGSKLTKIEEYGLCLNSLRNLNCVVINLDNPFTIVDNSFNYQHDLVANEFIFIVKDGTSELFKSKWQSYSFNTMNAKDITAIIHTKADCFNIVKGKMPNLGLTSYEHYCMGVEMFTNYSFSNIKYEVVYVIGLAEALYNNSYNTLDTLEKEYLDALEKELFYLSYNYFNKLAIYDDFEIKLIKNMISHYYSLPQVIRNDVKDLFDKISAVDEQVTNLSSLRSEISKKIMNFQCSSTVFDVEAYLNLQKEIKESDFERSIISSDVDAKLALLNCSYLMYKFVNFKGDYIHHITETIECLEGNSDGYNGIYGINFYMEALLDQDGRQKVYKVNQYEECLAEYENAKAEYCQNVIDEIDNLDLSLAFNDELYLSMINDFNSLPEINNCTYETVEKYNILILVYNLHAYLDNYSIITDENVTAANDLARRNDFTIEAYGTSSLINDDIASLISEYQTKKGEAENYLEGKYATLKNEIKNFKMNSEVFDNDAFDKMVSDFDNLGEYAININYCDENDYFDYFTLYKIICIYSEINDLVTAYPDSKVTASNYRDISNRLIGCTNPLTDDSEEGIENKFASIWYDDFDNLVNSMYYYNTYLQIIDAFENF